MLSAALPRAHVMRLRDAGLTMQQIADRARLPVSTINRVLYECGRGSLQRTAHAVRQQAPKGGAKGRLGAAARMG